MTASVRRVVGALALGAASGASVALAARLLRDLDAVTVQGRSMAPTFLPGDRLLVARLRRPPRVGEMVLAPDPRDPGRELIKRVAAVVAGASVTLRGDDPAHSTDARTFGELPIGDIGWRVVARYWPPPRRAATPSPPTRDRYSTLNGSARADLTAADLLPNPE